MKVSKEEFVFHDVYDAIKFVEDKLSTAALYEQLAEEASELAQAALKLSRIYRNENPTPISMLEAVDNLQEEFTDLLLVSDILGLVPNETLKKEKAYRWAGRLLRAMEE